MNNLLAVVCLGVGATAVMDLWGVVRRPLLGIPPPTTECWDAGLPT
ncbi:hypothetical protein G113_15121 [Aeromonas molluscorum 848]|uniref:Uncharacterized protein n=1 Tax=Aeromonas molluscorum 848 TaxID=1268236 RepID=R1F2V7_9GAMM|nr:hypothetical protein G113_15121 [Aeromonas molluscorum 848]